MLVIAVFLAIAVAVVVVALLFVIPLIAINQN
jgi:hypothetical protein